MVLAAGMGNRLKPLTDDRPKCLMPLAGRPLIEWTLNWLKEHGVTECAINLHYLQDQVKDFVGDGSRFGMTVHYSFEPVLLGTAGAVKKVADFFDDPFYMIYGDNFSRWDLGLLKACFDDRSVATPMAVMAVHWRDDVTHSGMIEMAEDGSILRIVEKPQVEEVTSHYVNAGFFYMHPRILKDIPPGKYCDFSYDVFPALLRRGDCMYAVKMDEPIIGIDDLDAYERANQLAAKILSGKKQ
ncbi:MAG: NDP-sugar synthase [Deltaproteobacteria bacterium]|nr:NDP-sugar synthase [Deltaproteobacteria bacterium]